MPRTFDIALTEKGGGQDLNLEQIFFDIHLDETRKLISRGVFQIKISNGKVGGQDLCQMFAALNCNVDNLCMYILIFM